MTINNVDVIHVEAFQGSLGALDDVFSGEAFIVGSLAAPKDLGRNDDVGSLPPELANGLPHDLFGAAVGVDLGIVEEVDAVVAAALQERLRLLHVQLVSEADPRSIRELAHSQPRSPQLLVLHFLEKKICWLSCVLSLGEAYEKLWEM